MQITRLGIAIALVCALAACQKKAPEAGKVDGARIAGLSAPLADFFHGRRPPIASAEEGRTSLRMTLACYVSNSEGRRVAINDERILKV